MTAPAANCRVTPADIQDARPLLASSKVVLIQLEIALQTVMAAVAAARDCGVRVVLDTAPPAQIPDSIVTGVAAIKPNAKEAETLTGIRVEDAASARRAALALLERRPQSVAIEVGKEGNLIAWKGGESLLPRIPVNAVEPTGAGDAFAAVLAVELSRGRSVLEAAHIAVPAAALTTTRIGAHAGLPYRDAVMLATRQHSPKGRGVYAGANHRQLAGHQDQLQ